MGNKKSQLDVEEEKKMLQQKIEREKLRELEEKLKNSDFVKGFKSIKDIKQAFAKFDKQKDGFIQGEEYQDFLKDVAEKSGCEGTLLEDLLKIFDDNKDGKISESEFVHHITYLNPQVFLLLGSNNCGKTTVFKYFNPYHSEDFTFADIFNTIQAYLLGMAQEVSLYQEFSDKISHYRFSKSRRIHSNHFNIIKSLWEKKEIQTIYQKRLSEEKVPKNIE